MKRPTTAYVSILTVLRTQQNTTNDATPITRSPYIIFSPYQNTPEVLSGMMLTCPLERFYNIQQNFIEDIVEKNVKKIHENMQLKNHKINSISKYFIINGNYSLIFFIQDFTFI